MKPFIIVQWVSRSVSDGKSDPQRGSSPHVEAKRTCGRATERDRSCAERECRGATEPRDPYNCGSSPTRVGRTPSRCSVTKAIGRSYRRTYTTKHRRGLRTTHVLKRTVRALRESHAGLPLERSGATMGERALPNSPALSPAGGDGERINRIWRVSRQRARANGREIVVWQS